MDGVSSNNNCQITCSVLQGSILGVLMFLIYINDLFTASNIFSCILFADDNTGLLRGKNLEEVTNLANQGLAELQSWYQANKLSIHPKKCKAMLFKPKHLAPTIEQPLPISLNFNNEDFFIETIPNNSESSIRILGFDIDNKLNFDSHIDKIKSKLLSALHCVRSLKPYLNLDQLIQFYFAHIHSHITYSAIILSMASQQNIRMLQVLQNRVLRLMLGVSNRTNIDDFYKLVGVLKIEEVMHLSQASFMFDFCKNNIPSGFCTSWITNSIYRPSRQLRQDNNLHELMPILSSLENHPLILFPRIWNDISNEIRACKYKSAFKTRLKENYPLSN